MAALLALALLGAVPGEDVPVAVLAHAVEKGTRLEAADFAIEPRAAAAARGALRAEDAAGMEAVRRLAAGAVVRRTDLTRPQLVRRGEPVTIRIVNGPLVITTGGRALASGSQGEMVRVVASATSRTLDGIVDGSGTVRVAAP